MNQPGHLLKKLLRAGIFRMHAHHIGDQRMHPVQIQIPLLHHLKRRAELIQSAHQHAAHSHIHARLRDVLRRKVHIKNGGHTAGQIFQNGQLGQVVVVLIRHLRLQRENLRVQPFLKRHIVRKGTHGNHGGMSVRVLEAGHEHVSFTVDLPVPYDAVLPRSFVKIIQIAAVPDIKDPVIFHPQLAFQQGAAIGHGHNSRIVKSDFHLFQTSPLRFYSAPKASGRSSFSLYT